MQCNTTQSNTIQHNTTQHNEIQYNPIQNNTVQHNTTIQYETLRTYTLQADQIQGIPPQRLPWFLGRPPNGHQRPRMAAPSFRLSKKKKKHRFHKKVRFIADVVPKRLLNARFRTTSAVKRTCLWFFFVFFGKSETGGGPPRSPPLCYWESL